MAVKRPPTGRGRGVLSLSRDYSAQGITYCGVTQPDGTWTDIGPLARDSVVTNTDGPIPADFSKLGAHRFSQSDQRIELADGPMIDSGQPFTICWQVICTDDDNYPIILTCEDSGPSDGIFQMLYSNRGSYQDVAASYNTSLQVRWRVFETPTLNAMHYGVLSYNGNGHDVQDNYTFALNGEIDPDRGDTGTFSAAADNRIGGSSGSAGFSWKGTIYQIRLYDREWTRAEMIAWAPGADVHRAFSFNRRLISLPVAAIPPPVNVYQMVI